MGDKQESADSLKVLNYKMLCMCLRYSTPKSRRNDWFEFHRKQWSRKCFSIRDYQIQLQESGVRSNTYLERFAQFANRHARCFPFGGKYSDIANPSKAPLVRCGHSWACPWCWTRNLGSSLIRNWSILESIRKHEPEGLQWHVLRACWPIGPLMSLDALTVADRQKRFIDFRSTLMTAVREQTKLISGISHHRLRPLAHDIAQGQSPVLALDLRIALLCKPDILQLRRLPTNLSKSFDGIQIKPIKCYLRDQYVMLGLSLGSYPGPLLYSNSDTMIQLARLRSQLPTRRAACRSAINLKLKKRSDEIETTEDLGVLCE